jgi:hypothetical protein
LSTSNFGWVLSTSSDILSTLSFWLSMYILFLLSQCLILCVDPRAKYIRLAITSKIAAEYLQSLGMIPLGKLMLNLVWHAPDSVLSTCPRLSLSSCMKMAMLGGCHPPGTNPTIASYNASIVKDYSAVNSMACF